MFGQPPPTPAAADPAGHVVVQPGWVTRPTGDDMADAYPSGALRAGVTGMAVLTCRVSLQGAATGCEVLQDAPAGLGFGDAALAVSRRFRFSPLMRDGQPSADGEVTIPLNFKFPGGTSQTAAAAPRLWREAVAGEPMPTARTGPCPGAPEKLCTNETFAWAAAPEPWAFAGLYGVSAFVCRVAPTGAMADCKSASLTPAAHVRAAQHYVSRYRAPPEANGKPTAGALATFLVVPPGPPG